MSLTFALTCGTTAHNLTALATSPMRLPQSITCYTGEVLLSLHGHLYALCLHIDAA